MKWQTDLDGILVLEADGKTPRSANDMAAGWLFNTGGQKLPAKTATVKQPLWLEVSQAVRAAIKGGESYQTEAEVIPANSKSVRAFSILVIPGEDNVIVVLRDLEPQRQLERRLADAEQRFSDIADSFADWLWEIDAQLKVTYVSRGRSRSDVAVRAGVSFISCFAPEERVRVKKEFEDLISRQEAFYDFEYWGSDAQGLRVCWSISGVPALDSDGRLLGFRGVARDISAEKSSQDQLYYMANNDQLTGLFNRGRFYDELARAVRDMRRHNKQGVLVLLDLDRFKYVNDTFGHEAGDSMLIHVATLLGDQISKSDVLARLGGDEFALIFQDLNTIDAIKRVQKLLERLSEKPFTYNGQDVSLSASVGMVMFPDQGTASGELLSKADIAMYRAKQQGRNRFHIFDETAVHDHNMAKRLEVVDFIVRCLEEGRIELHYQPIVPLQQPGKIRHYETLCRMLDDKGNIVPPIHFIETAEDFGLIARIDEYVCERTLKFLSDEIQKGRDLHLSINLSGLTFEDEETMARIKDMLAKSKLPEGAVIFEITETAALRDIGKAQRVIGDLKKYGCKFALDDFGVGYSSFNYIKHLDIDYLKIDGSFVRNLNENEDDKVFVKALADVARGMNIFTVAEMVENDDLVQHLIEIGIDFGQGYHFGRPQPRLLDE